MKNQSYKSELDISQPVCAMCEQQREMDVNRET